jgi:hypothetical protein
VGVDAGGGAHGKVTVSVPSDMDLEVLLEIPSSEVQEEPALVVDSSSMNAAVYNADFAGAAADRVCLTLPTGALPAA